MTEFRLLPELTERNRVFWTAGGEGRLMLWRCQDCRCWLHPPAPVCPSCLSRDLKPEQVSGRGTLVSITVNHQPWNATVPVPYSIGLIELDDAPGLRLMTGVEGEPPIGALMEVGFVNDRDVWIPVFAEVGQ
ncbi:Zn-ribbon domain-containing OB-fold protein [Actinocorallia sp. A-T 12471]|uniref:Zn-ribbon domain-containing OB-fold protein n=1 Tax=Actinocorallia sp. A-T 12471 TaxID=3089813 RepID=UPI0029CFAC80|nr:OB-fold domain-containing protein [Actinocorallia sp. A-T 12471]MDX6741490.1 OB-fold domain-containing protein [Actinocorallia sp. A-T 12471]